MADITRRQDQQIANSVRTLFKDMGDGTHAEVLYIGDGVIGFTSSAKDDQIGALITIPAQHYEVHEGETFTVSLLDTNIANSATIIILLRTAAKYAHLTFFASLGGDATIEFIEDPTVSNAGTPMTEWNNKRYSTTEPTVTAFSAPTISAGSNPLEGFLPGGTGGNSSGGLLRPDVEFILKPNEDYALRLTNISGQAKGGCIVISWYEESTP